jgi:hypothetical protein
MGQQEEVWRDGQCKRCQQNNTKQSHTKYQEGDGSKKQRRWPEGMEKKK